MSKQTNKDSSQAIYGIAPYPIKAGDEYMDAKHVQHFKAILAAWRKELVEELNRTVHHIQDETVNHADPNDRASQETEFTLELRSRDRERKLIKKIDDSITQLDQDDYGFCVNCGDEIGIRRLEARPTATLCIECKSLDEIREKQVMN